MQQRKFKAMGKFLGSCLEKVHMQIKNMETIVGMDNVMAGVQNANSRIELQNRENT